MKFIILLSLAVLFTACASPSTESRRSLASASENRASSKCTKPGPTMHFRRYKVSCVQDCDRIHPLNRKLCKKSYSLLLSRHE